MNSDQVPSAHTVASASPLSLQELEICAGHILALLPAGGKILFPNHSTLLNAEPISDLVLDAGEKLGIIARARLSLGLDGRAHFSIPAWVEVRPEVFRPIGRVHSNAVDPKYTLLYLMLNICACIAHGHGCTTITASENDHRNPTMDPAHHSNIDRLYRHFFASVPDRMGMFTGSLALPTIFFTLEHEEHRTYRLQRESRQRTGARAANLRKPREVGWKGPA